MNEEEKARYLANIYLAISADGDVDQDERRLFDSLARDIQAGWDERGKAEALAASGRVQTQVSDRWSDRIRNLEDMILAVYCDGEIDPSEKQLIVKYAKHLEIDQKQLGRIPQETKRRHALRKKIEQETKQRLSLAPIPYGIDKRPMPQGIDLDQLMPERVGPFQREPVPVPEDVHIEIYANYKADGFGIFMELGIGDDPAIAQTGVKTASAELDGAGEVLAESFGTDPSFHKAKAGGGAFLAWTRGGYYFSAHANKGGEPALDAFMEAFPF